MNDLNEELEQEAGGLDLRQFFALMWKWKLLIFIAAVICGTAAFLISRQTRPTYEASTTVLVNEAPSTQSNDYNSLLTSVRLTSTYSEMMTDDLILDEVALQLNYSEGGNALKKYVTASPVKDTQLITVTVRSTDPAFAMQAANTVVDVFAKKKLSIQQSRFTESKQNLQTRIDDLEGQIKALEESAQG